MIGRNKAEAYYKLMEAFKLSEWKQFVRQKLGLNEATIEEIEHDYRGVKEKKYQMIIAWEQKGELKILLFNICKTLELIY